MSGNAQISYEVFNVDNVEDKVTVTVNYNITPTGINDEILNVNVKAFPNPTAGSFVNFSILLPSSVSNPKLAIYNLLGVKVLEKEIDSANQNIELDISRFPKGIYLYSVFSENEILITKKLIVR
jgi:hypothetical protein